MPFNCHGPPLSLSGRLWSLERLCNYLVVIFKDLIEMETEDYDNSKQNAQWCI